MSEQYLGPFAFRSYLRLRKRARFWRGVGFRICTVGAALIAFGKECDEEADEKAKTAEKEWMEVIDWPTTGLSKG